MYIKVSCLAQFLAANLGVKKKKKDSKTLLNKSFAISKDE